MSAITQCAECGGTIYDATPFDRASWIHSMNASPYCNSTLARPVTA
jgi:hypothetical protein